MSLTHAEIYANVIKARPECACQRVATKGEQWFLFADPCHASVCIALITDHWAEMLPPFHMLIRIGGNPTRWRVGDEDHNYWPQSSSRFHALAEFLVPGSTQETNKQ